MIRVSLLTLASVCLGCLVAFALEISTLEVYLSVEQGVVYSESLVVTNDTDEGQVLKLYMGDWDRDEYGQNRFFPSGTISRSLTPWVSLQSSSSLELAPRETRTVMLHVAIPGVEEADLGGTYWGMLFVEVVAPAEDGGAGAAVFSTLRYGVKVYATIAGSENSVGVVRHVSVGQRPGELLVTVEYENAGNVIQDVMARCDVVDQAGGTVRSALLGACPVLPGCVRTLEIVLDPLAAGLYQAVAQVDYGGIALVAGVYAFRVR